MYSIPTLRFNRATFAALLSVSALLSACTDQENSSSNLTAPLAPQTGLTAYLSLSTTAPLAGERVEVSINAVRGAQELPIGSYTFKLAFDTVGLRFVESAQQSDGMVMANIADGVVYIAGASGSGFTSNRLATLRLEVRDPAAIKTLALELVEMNATDFGSHAKETSVDRRLFREAK